MSIRFALNRTCAPQLSLEDFIALATSVGVQAVEIRNDVEGREFADGTPARDVLARLQDAGLEVASVNALQRFNEWSPTRAKEAEAIIAYAAALGAPVTPTGRKEIGYAPLQLTDAGRASVLAGLEGVAVLHWHGDEFAIPDGAQRLAQTPGFPNQAFCLGDRVLGLQFHVEADHTRIERWLIGHALELAAAGIDPRQIRADATTCGPMLADVAVTTITSWLDRAERG